MPEFEQSNRNTPPDQASQGSSQGPNDHLTPDQLTYRALDVEGVHLISDGLIASAEVSERKAARHYRDAQEHTHSLLGLGRQSLRYRWETNSGDRDNIRAKHSREEAEVYSSFVREAELIVEFRIL